MARSHVRPETLPFVEKQRPLGFFPVRDGAEIAVFKLLWNRPLSLASSRYIRAPTTPPPKGAAQMASLSHRLNLELTRSFQPNLTSGALAVGMPLKFS
jgi:hypothetical protein